MDTEFCNRYRERNVSNPREMLALRDTPVDLAKWKLISFGRSPLTKVSVLVERGFVVIDLSKSVLGAARRVIKNLIDRRQGRQRASKSRNNIRRIGIAVLKNPVDLVAAGLNAFSIKCSAA